MAVRKIFIAEISRTMMYVADCARTRSNRARARALERERVTLRHRVCNLARREIARAKGDHLFSFRFVFSPPRTNVLKLN